MDYSYVGFGQVVIHGCPKIEVNYFYNYKYAVGSKVYDRVSARKGTLESVIVRKAWFVCDPRTAQNKILYKDNYNWVRNEYDLCSQAEAVSLITAYYEKKQMSIDQLLTELDC